MALRALLGIALALSPAAAYAATCPDALSFDACWDHIQGFKRSSSQYGEAKSFLESASVVAQERLLNLETGVDTREVGSTLGNLLPRLSLTGLTAPAADAAGPNPLGAALNLPALDGVVGNGAQLGLETELTPTLAKPVRDALERSGHAARIDELEDSLNSLDDQVARLTYAPRFLVGGREFRLYSDRFSALALQIEAQLQGSPAGQRKTEALRTLGRAIRSLPDPVKGRIRGKVLEKLTPEDLRCQAQDSCDDDVLVEAIRSSWESTAAADAEQSIERVREAHRHGLDRFADLVNNQPQLLVTARHLFRDPLVGAQATSLEVLYEGSFHSLSGFERGPGQVCRDGRGGWQAYGAAGQACLDAFTRYVAEEAMRTADRWAVGAEYARVAALHVQSPQDSLDLHLPEAQMWSGTLAYGRYLDVLGAPGSTRLDARARYEHFGNDGLRASRWVVSVVLTQKVMGVSLPFTLLYKSDGEFEADAANQVQALLGMNFDVLGAPRAIARPEPPVQVVPVPELPPAGIPGYGG